MDSADLTKNDQIREADLVAVRHRFWLEGETISAWAAKNGFSPATTYSLLAGRLRARRGEAHRIAIALGLKPLSRSETDGAAGKTPQVEEAAMK